MMANLSKICDDNRTFAPNVSLMEFSKVGRYSEVSLMDFSKKVFRISILNSTGSCLVESSQMHASLAL